MGSTEMKEPSGAADSCSQTEAFVRGQLVKCDKESGRSGLIYQDPHLFDIPLPWERKEFQNFRAAWGVCSPKWCSQNNSLSTLRPARMGSFVCDKGSRRIHKSSLDKHETGPIEEGVKFRRVPGTNGSGKNATQSTCFSPSATFNSS